MREGGEQQGVQVQRLHQQPEEISHDTVVAEDNRGLTGELHMSGKDRGGKIEVQIDCYERGTEPLFVCIIILLWRGCSG